MTDLEQLEHEYLGLFAFEQLWMSGDNIFLVTVHTDYSTKVETQDKTYFVEYNFWAYYERNNLVTFIGHL